MLENLWNQHSTVTGNSILDGLCRNSDLCMDSVLHIWTEATQGAKVHCRTNCLYSTSASWQKLNPLYVQWSSRVRPLEWFCHGLVEEVDEFQNALHQFLCGCKACPFEESSHQDGEPAFNLVEPGSMLGGIGKANAMGFIL